MLTINRITTEIFTDGKKDVATCVVLIKFDEPVTAPYDRSHPDGDQAEVTGFCVELDRELDKAWPRADDWAAFWAGGYALNPDGTRDEIMGYNPFLLIRFADGVVTAWLAEVERLLAAALKR
jgi:hypothetical protein